MSKMLAFDNQSGNLCVQPAQSGLTRDTLSNDGWATLNKNDCVALQKKSRVSLDLSHVGPVDSAGLAWLLNIKRDALKDKVTITFCAVPDKLDQLAALSGVNSLLNSES